ncbi:hypothetical protein L9F63_017729 [Diploptera punctata]|uniref:Small ribosomal subunit protein mS26 n=1 Tax=Diploptera punctata TaxID=6984 RepID=A0AAD7ZY87_DIPPU|nr:hypothetical protein L9F63_017729 [Diploptera punctata]
MFKFSNILNYTLKVNSNLKSDLLINSTSIQCVRWGRKPRWLPMAKSKLFRIPERPKIGENERIELKRLHDRYKTHMHAIRNYFQEETAKTSKTSVLALQEIEDEEQEHVRCMKENDEWNKQVALLREQRLKVEAERRREEVLKSMDEAQERKKLRLEEIEKMVREEKEKSKYYITAENIDKAIEDALATTVDHNFAVDLEGHLFKGRQTKPSDIYR